MKHLAEASPQIDYAAGTFVERRLFRAIGWIGLVLSTILLAQFTIEAYMFGRQGSGPFYLSHLIVDANVDSATSRALAALMERFAALALFAGSVGLIRAAPRTRSWLWLYVAAALCTALLHLGRIGLHVLERPRLPGTLSEYLYYIDAARQAVIVLVLPAIIAFLLIKADPADLYRK